MKTRLKKILDYRYTQIGLGKVYITGFILIAIFGTYSYLLTHRSNFFIYYEDGMFFTSMYQYRQHIDDVLPKAVVR